MKHLWKSSTIVLLLLSGAVSLVSMGPEQPEPKLSLAASIAKYGLLGTGAATLVMTLAQRQLPSLSTFAKIGGIAFALATLYKSPALVRSLLSQRQQPQVTSVHGQEQAVREIAQSGKLPEVLMPLIGSYLPFNFDQMIRVIALENTAEQFIKRAKFNDDDTEIITAILSASQTPIFRIDHWNIQAGRYHSSDFFFIPEDYVTVVSGISVNNKIALYVDERVKVLDLATKKESLVNWSGPAQEVDSTIVDSINFSANGTQLVVGGRGVDERLKLFIWNVTSVQAPILLSTDIYEVRGLSDVNFSSKGDKIITSAPYSSVRIFDVTTHEQLFTIGVSSIMQARFNADDTKIVILDTHGYIRIVDVNTRRILRMYGFFSDRCVSVCFSPKSPNLLAAGFQNGAVRIFNINKKEPLQVLRGHTKEVSFVNFNSAGNKIVTASGDGTVRIWRQPFARYKKQEAPEPKKEAERKQKAEEEGR